MNLTIFEKFVNSIGTGTDADAGHSSGTLTVMEYTGKTYEALSKEFGGNKPQRNLDKLHALTREMWANGYGGQADGLVRQFADEIGVNIP